MCGIAGFWGRIPDPPPEKVIQGMLGAIAHRGPDGQGKILFADAGLGHVRLAIIDLAGGGQPMSSVDHRFHISYNGELYNFRELRNELTGLGHSFRTRSDTEVVLTAYRQWGEESLHRFRGMFAFAIWDSVEHRGILARDRFGIKPLFYRKTDGDCLFFASEAKALLATLKQRPDLDLNGLHLLMNFRYIPGDQTLFSSIRQLAAGHCLLWHKNTSRIVRWAAPSSSDQVSECTRLRVTPLPADHSVDHPEEHLRTLVKQAVRRQLVSDVPLGGYLSAGLDSSTLAALAVCGDVTDRDRFPTFTIRTGDSPLEAQHAAETAGILGVKNYQESMPLDMETLLPRLIYHLEMPKVNGLQSALVAKLASQHVKVALSGLGGDEIFLGYNLHALLAFLEPWGSGPLRYGARLAGAGADFVCGKLGLAYEEWQRAGQILAGLPDFPRAYGILRNVWDSPQMRRRLYGPRMLDASLDNAAAFIRASWPGESDPVKAAAGFDLENKMINDLLLNEDRLSMAFGLEVRVPFLDEDLVATVSAIARRRRMPGGKLKHLMRQVVSPWLPAEILARPKSGFQVPIHQFFNSHLRPLCARYLSPERLKADGLFNPQFVTEVLSAKPHKRLRWHYFLLYLMLGTAIWIDIFEKGREVPPWN